MSKEIRLSEEEILDILRSHLATENSISVDEIVNLGIEFDLTEAKVKYRDEAWSRKKYYRAKDICVTGQIGRDEKSETTVHETEAIAEFVQEITLPGTEVYEAVQIYLNQKYNILNNEIVNLKIEAVESNEPVAVAKLRSERDLEKAIAIIKEHGLEVQKVKND